MNDGDNETMTHTSRFSQSSHTTLSKLCRVAVDRVTGSSNSKRLKSK